MKILVLNGSPRGEYSVTKQYMLYLSKLFSKDEFSILNIGQQIKAYEREDKLASLKEEINNAELIILSYPVYTFLAPAQLHRFIEILQENDINFDGKFVTQFSTSKHFYDVTAHSVIKECILDLKGKYINGLSSDMDDLTSKNGGEEIKNWFKFIKAQINSDICTKRDFIDTKSNVYYRLIENETPKNDAKKVLIVTDEKDNESLKNMTEDFIKLMPYKVELFNLNDFSFKCGCLGCLKCTSDAVCQVKDGFKDVLDKINGYDAILMAFTIKNHCFSSLYKTYYDRQFVNGHRPVTAGKPTAYIVSGALSSEPTLQEYIDAKSSVGGNMNCGIICDETNTFESIKNAVFKLTYALENNIKPSHDFYEIGGMRIFRDLIWLMRGLMKADYEFYKKEGLLDFPQKKRGTMIAMKLVGKMMKSKAINKKMPNMMNDGMLMMYKKAIEKASPIE